MKFSLTNLREANCPGVWHEAIAAGEIAGGLVEVPDDSANALLAKCGDLRPVPSKAARKSTAAAPMIQAPHLRRLVKMPASVSRSQPIPFERWPFAFKVLARLATPEDQGIGDVIERIVGPIGGRAFKVWHQLATGHDCGCGARKQALNQKYPLTTLPGL